MSNPFDLPYESLPQTIPVFPLSGVILLPRGQLPLNIFEPRYLAMVLDALGNQRMIGMVQPKGKGVGSQPLLYSTGCAGRITNFQETDDGRLLISLKGICRFQIREELSTPRPYRMVSADWSIYRGDMEAPKPLAIDSKRFLTNLQAFCERHSLDVDFAYIKTVPSLVLIDYLSQVLPFEAADKQALLEAPDATFRAQTLNTLLEMENAQTAEGVKVRQ